MQLEIEALIEHTTSRMLFGIDLGRHYDLRQPALCASRPALAGGGYNVLQQRVVLLLCLAIALSACTSRAPYRTASVEGGENAAQVADVICDAKADSDPHECARSALVRRHYEYAGESNAYYTAFVEFDDQGWFWDRAQLESLLRFLYQPQRAPRADKDEFLIILYAHGWQHGASGCDNNVVCFQRLLERFDLLERTIGNARTIVGVYVGWRGRSLDVSFLDNLSFWERKNTAGRVGNGGVTTLVSQLDDFRRYKNPRRARDKTHLVVTGHSFGGKVIYSAISNLVLERAASMSVSNSSTDGAIKYDIARSIGDLVVLVNPAFEGTLYEPLHDMAANRCYPETQRPVMLVMTSKADDATKRAFPIGRWFSTFFQRDRSSGARDGQNASMVGTVGHLDRYRTHTLSLRDPIYDKHAAGDADNECGCPWLPPISEFDRDTEESTLRTLSTLDRITRSTRETKRYVYGDGLVLSREDEVAQYSPNHPYLVIATEPEIIPDHNAIYDENFTDFLRRFYIRHVLNQRTFARQCYTGASACAKTDITPCESSCRRPDGSSCSGRALAR